MSHRSVTEALSAEASLVQGPNCSGFPTLYLLNRVHALRNTAFTREKNVLGDQEGFSDYVALVERSKEFMEKWQQQTKNLEVPQNDATECVTAG